MTTSRSLRVLVVPLFVLACLLLGGSTRSAWPNMALQLGAIAILAWAGLSAPRAQAGAPGRNLTALCVAVVALMVLQIIPLPPGIWTKLPGRDLVVQGYLLLGQPLPWLPLSLAPYDTMASALWLLPPLAILAAMLRLAAYRELWLAIALGAAAFAGVLLGVLQVTSGDILNSPYYLYAVTNNGQATGFFANSNHMATLLIATIPFMVALLGVKRSGKRYMQKDAGRFAILGGAILVLLFGLALNPSTAGIGLGVAVVAASLLIGTSLGARWARWGIAGVAALGVAAVVAIFASPLENSLAAAGADQSYSTRSTSFSNSLRAVADTFPVGTGSGSFASVYPAYEDPDVVDRWYVNHVHNDYIELVLETGLAGLLLILLFLLWWAGQAIAIWRAPVIDHFARAASVASGAILVHSMVDFPLRTSAIAAVFAMCVALMAGSRLRLKGRASAGNAQGARHLTVD